MTKVLQRLRLIAVTIVILSIVSLPGIINLAINSTARADTGEVLITSIGQNPGSLMVKVMLAEIGVNFNYQPVIKADELHEYKYIIMSVGYSPKGLSAADISFREELNRTRGLIEEIKAREYPLIFVHLGGNFRRDENTNILIREVAPHASALVITEESNYDNYFTQLAAENSIRVIKVKGLSHLDDIFREIFEEDTGKK